MTRLHPAPARQANDERIPNDEFPIRGSVLAQLFVIRASSLLRHSAFELRLLLG
jgi:hypothetical protein